MSDDTKTPSLAQAAAGPSGEVVKPRSIENPMTSWVRGGTVTSAHERQLEQQKHEAEQARQVEDARERIAAQNPDNAKQHKHVIGGNKAFPGIVLEVREPRDHKVLDYIECELTAVDDGSLVLVIACWSCYQKTGRTEQLTIRQNHRRFELDMRRAGEIWVNPITKQVITLAGTIHLTEVTTCPVCSMRFVIDNSVVREV